MKQVGELIREAIEAMELGASENAFAAACAALKATLGKSSAAANGAPNGGDYHDFVRQNWRLLAFMGLPRALPLPLDVNHKLAGIVHGFNISGAEQLVVHLIRQTAQMNRPPAQFRFHTGGQFEIRNNLIYVPDALIGGVVGIVILQPANRDQTVPDQFWINISDFKMFVSEFWGRIDLAERILNLYNG